MFFVVSLIVPGRTKLPLWMNLIAVRMNDAAKLRIFFHPCNFMANYLAVQGEITAFASQSET